MRTLLIAVALSFFAVSGLSADPAPAPLVWTAPSSETKYPVDWLTTDGQHFYKVTVLKVEPDGVTIGHRDGGGFVSIFNLPPDLQHLLNYDPVIANLAAQERALQDAQEDTASNSQRIATVYIQMANIAVTKQARIDAFQEGITTLQLKADAADALHWSDPNQKNGDDYRSLAALLQVKLENTVADTSYPNDVSCKEGEIQCLKSRIAQLLKFAQAADQRDLSYGSGNYYLRRVSELQARLKAIQASS